MKLSDLHEDIYVKGKELFVNVSPDSDRRGSTKDMIVANHKPIGKVSSYTRDVPVYYAFSYIPGEDSTDMLKSLKGKGPYTVPEVRRTHFLDDSSSHMAAQLRKLRVSPDVIVAPNSSSPLLADFAQRLADKLDVPMTYIGAFDKVEDFELPEDRKEALAFVKRHFIDYDYLRSKIEGDTSKIEDDIAKNVLSNIKKHGGRIEAKHIFKQFGKFVKGFMAHKLKGDDEYELLDKNVLVLDDVLSSGTTMTELFRIAKDELGAASVMGAALFARTSVR
jgi:hypothetical protein